jgi:hypothetical protein
MVLWFMAVDGWLKCQVSSSTFMCRRFNPSTYLTHVTRANARMYDGVGVKELSGSISGDGGCSPLSNDCA